MRKILVVVFSFGASCVFAQKRYFGVEAGINIAHQNVTGVPPSGAVPGMGTQFYSIALPLAGVFYHCDLSATIGARLGLRYSSLGFGNHNGPQVVINYLSIPLNIHVNVSKCISVTAGSYVSFTINNSTFASTVPTSYFYKRDPITDWYHKNDFGLLLGAEFKPEPRVNIAVGYLFGTKNIWLKDMGGAYKFTNGALQLTFIYKFARSSQRQ